jgi:phosphoribosylformylglycinamidine (FGAM) synthase-like amidotransferase family enzyme
VYDTLQIVKVYDIVESGENSHGMCNGLKRIKKKKILVGYQVTSNLEEKYIF